MSLPLCFIGTPVSGLGLGGSTVGVPTINIDLIDIPKELLPGIYAGRVYVDGAWNAAAIHYGPRPVFAAPESFEVHVLDTKVVAQPEQLVIEVVERLRDVKNFASTEALREAIEEDIRRTREIG